MAKVFKQRSTVAPALGLNNTKSNKHVGNIRLVIATRQYEPFKPLTQHQINI